MNSAQRSRHWIHTSFFATKTVKLNLTVDTRRNSTDQQRSLFMTMANFQTALEMMTLKESDNMDVLWHGPVRFKRSAQKLDQNAIDLPKFLHLLCSLLSTFDEHFQFRDFNSVIKMVAPCHSTPFPPHKNNVSSCSITR
jgi:hypothetical protein